MKLKLTANSNNITILFLSRKQDQIDNGEFEKNMNMLSVCCTYNSIFNIYICRRNCVNFPNGVGKSIF